MANDTNNSEFVNKKKLNYFFNKINDFFKEKREVAYKYKNFSLEDILAQAPKYYSFIQLVEKLNKFISKDANWLEHFIEKSRINFDFKAYQTWKHGKELTEKKYNYTQSPSKFIYVLQDFFIDLLESIQILLTMEFYIDEDNYRSFLRKNPKIDYKMKANYIVSSPPSEEIEMIFSFISILIDFDMKYDFKTALLIDTSLCIQIYRELDNTKIFDLLKKKEFYLKYRLEYLKHTLPADRREIPFEDDIVRVGDDFLESIQDFRHVYREYTSKLIEKTRQAKRNFS